jgi:hypothetical protein
MKNIDFINAIERVIEKRQLKGATDKNIIEYLNKLTTTWKNNSEIKNWIIDVINFFDSIQSKK